MTRHLIDRLHVEATVLAVVLAAAGVTTAAHLVTGWAKTFAVRLLDVLEPWS